jgi:hypothetical protein
MAMNDKDDYSCSELCFLKSKHRKSSELDEKVHDCACDCGEDQQI